jgi:pyruvate/2-oxoglutarate dehydrogenase complex dihydrolipoamide acyltransferase (E2) component
MPKSGISVESCIIGEWKKKVGDAVKMGEILFTYETDKSSFECESTAEGELLEIFFNDGDEVPCLENVCAIGNKGDDTASLRPGAAAAAPAAAPAEVGEEEMAAIAYVLHTFYNQHDEESDILTIRHDDVAYSPWNQKSIIF